MEPCIIIHGGSAFLPEELKESFRAEIQLAARRGYDVLLQGGNAVDAVEVAVRNMEDNPIFNAGHGCCVTEDNTAELDAFIMNGHNLATGAVACVQAISNPVSLAWHVMEDTSHCLLAGEGALKFAKRIGFPVLEDPSELITEESYRRFCASLGEQVIPNQVNSDLNLKGDEAVTNADDAIKHGQGFDTVGAVAMDLHGTLASATSTGGCPKKLSGRVGDSPLIGCGGYANSVGAASTTGIGEQLMKMVLARDVVRNMEDGLNPTQACQKSVNRMVASLRGVGGVIALNSHGDFGLAFSSQQMTWASVRCRVLKYGIEPGEEQQVPI